MSAHGNATASWDRRRAAEPRHGRFWSTWNNKWKNFHIEKLLQKCISNEIETVLEKIKNLIEFSILKRGISLGVCRSGA